jgi:hypothetical protein
MRSVAIAAGVLPPKSSKFCPLEVSATLTIFSQVIKNMKCRRFRDVPVAFSLQAGQDIGGRGEIPLFGPISGKAKRPLQNKNLT